MSRFDYVKYDAKAVNEQETFKALMMLVEQNIDKFIKSPRAKALAMTKLEETYWWISKGIRDDQIERNGTAELQEERRDS